MKRAQRTDVHRPGAIVPAHYEQWNDYSLPGPMMFPGFGVNCARPYHVYDAKGAFVKTVTPVCADTGRCCVASTHRHAEREGREIFGGLGRCGVCGAHFNHGTMFRHEQTGAIVHMGHDCARKYELMLDLSAWELERGRVEKANAVAITRAKNEKRRATFLAKYPGLAEALEVEHPIIKDIGSRFTKYLEISEKQVALVLKLADEVRNPPRAEEQHVAAPVGKGITFEGAIVGAKIHETNFGEAWKITVKVVTPTGSWLAWGTVPRSIMDAVVAHVEAAELASRNEWTEKQKARLAVGEDIEATPQREDRATAIRRKLLATRVQIKATLECGREPHFAFMKRPSGAIVEVQP